VQRTLTLEDGTPMAFVDLPKRQADARAPVLVFLHGWAVSSIAFRAQHTLNEHFRLLIPNLRGHAASPAGPDARLSMTQLAADVAWLLRRVVPPNVPVIGVGWSMGASVLWLAASGPARGAFAGLVSVDMSPRVLNGSDWSLGLRGPYSRAQVEGTLRTIATDWAGHCHRFLDRILAPGAALPLGLGEDALSREPATMARLWQSLCQLDARATVSGLREPHLLIRGAESQLYDLATQDDLATRLPQAEALSFSQSGHAPHIEQPEAFNDAVAAFCHRVAGPVGVTVGVAGTG
jgi:pimeloyl-[acyl-carrier protein] methyl ester esterase